MKKSFISDVNSLITLIMTSSLNRPFLVFGNSEFKEVKRRLLNDRRRKYYFGKVDARANIFVVTKLEDFDWELDFSNNNLTQNGENR